MAAASNMLLLAQSRPLLPLVFELYGVGVIAGSRLWDWPGGSGAGWVFQGADGRVLASVRGRSHWSLLPVGAAEVPHAQASLQQDDTEGFGVLDKGSM